MAIIYWGFIFLSHIMPPKLAVFITERIADFGYFTFSKKRGKIVTSNLKRVYENISFPEAKKLSLEIYRNFAKFIYEFLILPRLNKENLSDWLEVEHREYLDTALKEGKGVLVLSAHLGNWELGAGMLGVLGYSPTVIAFPQVSRYVKNFFTGRRETVGMKVVYVEQRLFPAVVALKRGKVVATLGDRAYSGPTHEVEFFGKPFSFPEGIFELVRRTQSSIVPAFCVREDGKYRVYLEPPLKGGVEEWARVLEKYVRKYTSQWFLFDPL